MRWLSAWTQQCHVPPSLLAPACPRQGRGRPGVRLSARGSQRGWRDVTFTGKTFSSCREASGRASSLHSVGVPVSLCVLYVNSSRGPSWSDSLSPALLCARLVGAGCWVLPRKPSEDPQAQGPALVLGGRLPEFLAGTGAPLLPLPGTEVGVAGGPSSLGAPLCRLAVTVTRGCTDFGERTSSRRQPSPCRSMVHPVVLVLRVVPLLFSESQTWGVRPLPALQQNGADSVKRASVPLPRWHTC